MTHRHVRILLISILLLFLVNYETTRSSDTTRSQPTPESQPTQNNLSPTSLQVVRHTSSESKLPPLSKTITNVASIQTLYMTAIALPDNLSKCYLPLPSNPARGSGRLLPSDLFQCSSIGQRDGSERGGMPYAEVLLRAERQSRDAEDDRSWRI